MKYKVLDTNVILTNANNVLTLGADGSTIVIPETVVDELDSKKSVIGEIGFQAREFGRILACATELPLEQVEDLTISSFKCEDSIIQLVSTSTYPAFDDVSPSIINDRKIIEIAQQYQNIFGSTTFISIDVMCRTRAKSLGLVAEDFKEVERAEYDFVKIIDTDFETFSNLHNKPITEVNPDHNPENFNYIFTCADTAQVKLANIDNNLKIDVLGKVTETELGKQSVTPANVEQLFLSRAIQDTTIDLILCEAKAGSGKTLVSLSNAIKLIGQNNPYESIIYIRASINDVEDVEEVGFLPGLEEKFAVYYHPIKDAIEYIARKKHSNSKLKCQELEEVVNAEVDSIIAKNHIQFMTGLGMRGRTFTNCIAIIDEVQGQSNSSVQKMLTRFGKGCKVIIIGSQNQIDNKYITKFNNGLSVLLDACTKPQTIIKLYAINLRKVIRSSLAEWSENLFSK